MNEKAIKDFCSMRKCAKVFRDNIRDECFYSSDYVKAKRVQVKVKSRGVISPSGNAARVTK